jgi:hypothetical protein
MPETRVDQLRRAVARVGCANGASQVGPTEIMKPSNCQFIVAASGLALLLGACGSGGDKSPPPPGGIASPDAGADDPRPPPDPDSDYVYPDVAHTGFDGTHQFRVPMSTNLTDNVPWEVGDPFIVDVAPAKAPEEYADFGETDAEKAGIVPYLRSLAPHGF